MGGFGKSVTGRVRKTNQDAIFVQNTAIGPFENLYIVADGMGGHLAGEIASSMAISGIMEYLANNAQTGGESVCDTLEAAVQSANKMIFETGIDDPERLGMGTTLLAATVKDGVVYIVNVGDSRLYAMNVGEGRISQITVDHSYVMELIMRGKITKDEARNHPNKNVITRALGTTSYIKCDHFTHKPADGEILLFCSDGLTNMLTDNEILNICGEYKKPAEMVDGLLKSANEKGGIDNITVIIYSGDDGV